jgi:UbiD family decarboxylase
MCTRLVDRGKRASDEPAWPDWIDDRGFDQNRGPNVSYKDLREFIKQVADLQALRHVAGADAKFEIGGITEVAAGLPDCPALLFEHIKGYPPGFPVFTNATTCAKGAALALGIDPTLRPLDALKVWKDKRRHLKPHQTKGKPLP